MKHLSQRTTIYVLLLAGIFLRMRHLLYFDFAHAPFRLGGLFVAFAEQIARNDFRLPVRIPFYSVGGIPFAYPPLAFYVEAGLIRLFPGKIFVIANLLPVSVAILALIGALFFLMEWFGDETLLPLAAMFAYAFLPSAFSDQIEAGGLAEAFGSLVLVLFFFVAMRLRSSVTWQRSLAFGVVLGLAILASPGSAVGAVILSVLLGIEVLWKERRRSFVPALTHMILAAVTGALLSSPYWFTVMHRHGRGIFVLPMLGQYENSSGGSFATTLLDHLMHFDVVQGEGVFFWNVLIFLGLLWLIAHGRWEWPVAFLAMFSIPREGVWLVALPAAVLFGYGVSAVRDFLEGEGRCKIVCALGVLFAGGLVARSFALSDALLSDRQWALNAAQVGLIRDASDLIPPGSEVLVLGNDALLEWAPYLLQREVINTKFGLEWEPAELKMILNLNQSLETADSWDAVWQDVHDATSVQDVYVLAADKKRLTALSRDSHLQIHLLVERPEIQVGVLKQP